VKAVLDGLNEIIEKVKYTRYHTTIHADQRLAYQMNAFTKILKAN